MMDDSRNMVKVPVRYAKKKYKRYEISICQGINIFTIPLLRSLQNGNFMVYDDNKRSE